jgi:hypothetical protein
MTEFKNSPRIHANTLDQTFATLAAHGNAEIEYCTPPNWHPDIVHRAKLDRYAYYRAWRKTILAKSRQLRIVLQDSPAGRVKLVFTLLPERVGEGS